MVPLHLCLPDEPTQRSFREWAREAVAAQDERDLLVDQIHLVRQKFSSLNLPFLSLPVKTKKEVALDVFIKMNTTAEPLTMFDIVVAQIEATMGKSLHDLVAELRATCPLVSEYYWPDDLALYASALLQGSAPTNATYMSREFGPRLLDTWDALIVGVQRTISFLEDERILDTARLPTDVVVPVLVALWAIAPKGLDAEGRARTLLRRYLWRAFFTNRYESSTNSRGFADFNDLKSLINGNADASPSIFDEAQYPLPDPAELAAAGWPKKRDRLARAILAIALKQGGVDLADSSPVSRSNLAKREYHHIFPDARLREKGLSEDKIYLSLNCALVTWHTNRNISAKEPERYLAERRVGNDLGENEIRARIATHLIPYDEMVSGDYEAFLAKRASMIHAAMFKLCATGATQVGQWFDAEKAEEALRKAAHERVWGNDDELVMVKLTPAVPIKVTKAEPEDDSAA